jgi:2-phospho-L-lactate guanylyltransferase
MRTAAILPVKRFSAAKQRLGASVPDALRLELARAMVSDVLAALQHTAALELTIVVTGQQDLARTAREHGAAVLEDRADDGQSAAVALGVAHALAAGFERVLCVPGDCPALDPDQLAGLLGQEALGVVIVPDRHGSGTNALLLAPADAIAPGFGPGSCARHRDLALATGVSWRVERVPSLLLDIDTGADLQELRERLSGLGAHASRTRAVLERSAAAAH